MFYVANISLSKDIVGEGYNVTIDWTVANEASSPKTFNITLRRNATLVYTKQLTLEGADSAELSLAWDTEGFPYGTYMITIGLNETEYQCHDVVVTISGDVDGDRDVDIFDIVLMAGVYGDYIPPDWPLPPQDIDGDSDVDIFDIVIAAGNYGKSW